MGKTASNLALSVGYAAVAVAIVLARREPAAGYEVSVYAGTPGAAWAALGVALTVAVATALACRGVHQAAAIGLGGFAMTAIVSLPVIRGYHFVGKGDGLTHLGWVRDFLGGAMAPHELFYPGLHTVASLLYLVAGVDVPHGLMLAVVALFVPFVIFVPLVVRDVTGNALAVGFAGIVAWFVLPINNIATHMGAHSNSNALFFVPVFLFALVAYLGRRSPDERLPLGLSPYGALIVLFGVALLLVHPQQMINVVVILAAISGVQYLARRRFDEHPILEHPTAHAYTAALGATFVVWAVANERFRNAFGGLLYGLATADIGGDEEVGQREASLAEIGGSLPELFAKLFGVSALVGFLVACFLLVLWAGRSRMNAESRSIVTYLGISLFPLGGIFLVYFVGTPTMAFRQVGFIFVLLTILGSIALAALVGWTGRFVPAGATTALAAVLLGACLVLALLTIFGSPFIYSPSQHVSEQTYHGYEAAIVNGNDQPYAGYGYNVYRYNDAIYGPETMTDEQAAIMGAGAPEGSVEMDAFNDRQYADAYPADGDYFLAVSEFDTTREFEIYQELNYERAAFEDLENHEGSAKYVSNEEFALYEIREE